MPKYVILFNWTDQGAANAKETVDRYQAARGLIESKGGKIESIHWTAGPYDIVAVAEGPDDETMAAIGLMLGAGGNLRSLTMRAFDEGEMRSIISKMG